MSLSRLCICFKVSISLRKKFIDGAHLVIVSLLVGQRSITIWRYILVLCASHVWSSSSSQMNLDKCLSCTHNNRTIIHNNFKKKKIDNKKYELNEDIFILIVLTISPSKIIWKFAVLLFYKFYKSYNNSITSITKGSVRNVKEKTRNDETSSKFIIITFRLILKGKIALAIVSMILPLWL